MLARVLAAIRRLPLEAAVEVALPATVLLFAFASSSVSVLLQIGRPARWIALFALAALAVAQFAALGPRLRSLPLAWAAAALFVAVAAESALWSVDAKQTLARTFTVGLLFVTAGALALASPNARDAATRVLRGVLVGVTLVALGSLVVLAVDHSYAVLPATTGAGWRFRGLGPTPDTVPMLLAVGLPLAVWLSLEGRRARWAGVTLVLLFAGEIALSGSRGGLLAGFVGALVTALVRPRSARAKLAASGAIVVLAVGCAALSKLPRPKPVDSGGVAVPAAPTPARTRGTNAQLVFRLEDEIGFPLKGAYRPPARRTLFGSSGRAEAWDGALAQGKHRVLAGYGFGTEDRVFVDRFYSFDGAFVENTYIGLFLQLGVAGVAIFGALLAALAWSALRLIRGGSAGPAAAAIGVLAAAVFSGVAQSGVLAAGNIAASSIWMCVLTLPVLARR